MRPHQDPLQVHGKESDPTIRFRCRARDARRALAPKLRQCIGAADRVALHVSKLRFDCVRV